MVFDVFETDFGKLLIAGTEMGISILSFQDGVDPVSPEEGWRKDAGAECLMPAKRQLTAYFKKEIREFDILLNLQGTPFQKLIWKQLEKIPYGHTVTYTDVACAAGKPSSARATGIACGKNPIPVIIPCHRVIGKNGRLTGYSSGLDIKKRLLRLEDVLLPEL